MFTPCKEEPTKQNKQFLHILVYQGSRVKAIDELIQTHLESLAEVSKRRILKKLLSIMDSSSHSLSATLTEVMSQHRQQSSEATREQHLDFMKLTHWTQTHKMCNVV